MAKSSQQAAAHFNSKDVRVDPLIGQEFVETAKAIKGKQNSLMKQIISLGFLFDMSIASLSKMLAEMGS